MLRSYNVILKKEIVVRHGWLISFLDQMYQKKNSFCYDFFFTLCSKVFRVFYDRLVDDDDRKWLFNQCREVIKENMQQNFDQLFAHLDSDSDGTVTEDDIRSLIYCDFADPKSDSKLYIEVRDLDQLRVVAEGYLEEFNNISKKPMNLVLFRWH